MNKIESVTVKVGQTWRDYDSRYRAASGPPRLIKVLLICGKKARVQSSSGRKTWVKLDRFRATASGYKLVSEGEAEA